MSRDVDDWPQHLIEEVVPVRDPRAHQAQICRFVPPRPMGPEPGGGSLKRLLQQRRRSIVERVCERDPRLHPFEPMGFQRKRSKKRRRHAQWVDSGADVVNERGCCEFGAACSAANGGRCLQHDDALSGLGQDDRCRQTIRA